ncbi:MAG: hypothetical protein PF505_11955 [Vallitaleaceae bacterium]|jgi:hypothetical protein|nr:hypothetical protein [Vallitaleaceae bacterium]
MRMSDFKGLFKKSYAVIDSVENPYGDYYIVKVIPETDVQWHEERR